MSDTIIPHEIPIPGELAPELVTYKPPARSYVLLNSKKTQVITMYVGTMRIIPPVDVVGHEEYRETDADGDPIPGSCVFKDLYSFDPEIGDDILVFDAAKAIAHILGIQIGSDGKGAVATSRFAAGGLSVLPRHPTKETVRSAHDRGKKMAFLIEVDNARKTIEGIDEKNAKRRAAGMDAVHGGAAYERAKQVIDRYTELVKQEVDLASEPQQNEVIDEELEILALARAKAQQLATTVEPEKELDRKAIFQSLMADPKIRKWAEKEWRIQRRGHLPAKAAELDAAIAAGLAAPDAPPLPPDIPAAPPDQEK